MILTFALLLTLVSDKIDNDLIVKSWKKYATTIATTSFRCKAILTVAGKDSMSYETIVKHGSNGKVLIQKTEIDHRRKTSRTFLFCISEKYCFHIVKQREAWLLESVAPPEDTSLAYIKSGIKDEKGLLRRPMYIHQRGNLLESIESGKLLCTATTNPNEFEIRNPDCNPRARDYLVSAKIKLGGPPSYLISSAEIKRRYIDGEGEIIVTHENIIEDGVELIKKYHYRILDKTTSHGIEDISYLARYDEFHSNLHEDDVFFLSYYSIPEPPWLSSNSLSRIPWFFYITIVGIALLIVACVILSWKKPLVKDALNR